jgi:hypothetical protein
MKSNEAFLDCDSQPTFEVSIEDYVRVKRMKIQYHVRPSPDEVDDRQSLQQ